MQIDIRSNVSDVLERLNRRRDDVLEKAIPRALNRTGDMAATYANRRLRQAGYNFKAGEIADAIYLSKASRSRMTVVMRVRRRAKLLLSFNAKETKQGVRVKVKGTTKLIKGAFIGQLRNGEQAVFIDDKTAGKTILRKTRDHKHGSVGGWRAYPVRKLYGPSVGGAYANDQVQSDMATFIGSTFGARLEHEIKYLTR